MENELNEQTQAESHTAVAEEISGESEGGVSLGKFKDVNALLSAYNSLQSEFTKRCQKIKELEARPMVEQAKASTETDKDTAIKAEQGITDFDKNEILKGYLKNVMKAKQSAIIMDESGAGVITPVSKPKTIAEAGKLALMDFEKHGA